LSEGGLQPEIDGILQPAAMGEGRSRKWHGMEAPFEAGERDLLVEPA
jgi:hypothetical protein